MSPGDKVRRRRDGLLGTVVSADGDDVVVEMPDGERRTWDRSGLAFVQRTFKPRATGGASDRARAAYRMHLEEGKSARELAAFYGVKPATVQGWFTDAAAAELDERRLRALGRTG